ncbi:MAG: TlpA family protein disulfide reductase [Thermoguttaceae bacterium]|nr:TlpA family protein disulfide reductase [Thermoguttaceae bacterium]
MNVKTFIVAFAVGIACFVTQRDNLTFAQEDAKEYVEADEESFDLSVFDVPEGKDEAFYSETFDRICDCFHIVVAKHYEEVVDSGKHAYAMERIYRGLENATDEALVEKCNSAFKSYVSKIAVADFDKVLAVYEHEKASGKSEKRISIALQNMFAARLWRPDVTRDDYKAIGNDLVAIKNEADPKAVDSIAYSLLRVAPDVAKDAAEQIVEAYAESGDSEKMAVAKRLEGAIRLAFLEGNEIKVEGLFLDKTEIDWETYRGKVVLLDFWATWCGACISEFPDILAFYEKYRDRGFEVVGYSCDKDVETLKAVLNGPIASFLKGELPWKTLSLALSTEVKENGGKEYLDLVEYYGVHALPTMILVGRDGKVISLDARGDELKRLLEEQFPDVE